MSNFATIILAAGQGTRFKSELPKVMHRLGGIPLVEHVCRAAKNAGTDKTVVVVGHGAEIVKNHFESVGGIEFALQKQQLGTGDAAAAGCAGLGDFAGAVAILSGDVPFIEAATISSMVDLLEKSGSALVVATARPQSVEGLGRIVRNDSGQLVRIVEEKDASTEEKNITEINVGVYVARSDYLFESVSKLSNDNAQGEYYLTDIVAAALQGGKKVATCLIEDVAECFGINHRGQLALAESMLQAQIADRLMRDGVTMIRPETVTIELDVKVAGDVTIWPGVVITGTSEIAAGASIGTGAVIGDSKVGRNATIKPYSVLEQAEVGEDCSVGPFARLRPGARLLTDARVGNFVEVKNSELGRSAKAGHLSYLGDCTIGARANIGAGTITCNYDGVNKHRTIIGADAFIGSNTALVAPVKVGDRAIIGAGSTITKEVSDGSLGLSRSEQKNLAGFADKMRPRKEKK
jgi:bifunctional UDP-N-acetylglucosamine pyrophosphorylase / glucosamine-1-phosphate N-acetyltransferase